MNRLWPGVKGVFNCARENAVSIGKSGKNRVFVYLSIYGHQFGPPKDFFRGEWRHIHVPPRTFFPVCRILRSFECWSGSLWRTFECRGSLLWTVEDKLRIYSLKLDLMTFKNLADMSSRNVYDLSYEQKATVWLRIVYPSMKTHTAFCWINWRRNV